MVSEYKRGYLDLGVGMHSTRCRCCSSCSAVNGGEHLEKTMLLPGVVVQWKMFFI